MARVYVDRGAPGGTTYRVSRPGLSLLTTDRAKAEREAGPLAQWIEITPHRTPEPFSWGSRKDLWRT